ncbi:MAG: phosphotransferase, partial [Actinomycetota bacterium]
EHRQAVGELVADAFGPDRCRVERLTDVNRGRGAFSVVLRAELTGIGPNGEEQSPGAVPSSVVAKLPVDGPNGRAATIGGAYVREALAYRTIIADSPVRAPLLHAIRQPADGTCSLLLEDLGRYRAADQLDGLEVVDALRVAASLRRLHRAWADKSRLAGLSVRRNTVGGFTPDGLRLGLAALDTRWADHVTDDHRRTFRDLVAVRAGLVERFEAAPQTLCHGDPRADNLVFDDTREIDDQLNTERTGAPCDGDGDETEGEPRSGTDAVILFDWQQLAVQFGEADLAWLAATSLTAPVRRELDRQLAAAYDGDLDRYRLGFALPGLAVLMLAQRDFPTERARRFVAVSLQRIATALDDLEVAALG